MATRDNSFWQRALLALSVILLISATSFAAAGKLRVTVTDKESGELLDAASIMDKGQNFGGSTFEGVATIVGISPGVYEVMVSRLNYHSQTIEGVTVSTDLTTDIKVQLALSTIQAGPVIVRYVAPAVVLDVTGHDNKVGRRELESIKAVEIGDVLKATTGFKIDIEGRFHVRGGRENGVAILVDGVDRRDVQVSTNTNVSITSESVEEINILSGGFNAEYGNAGAIVSITSSEGDKNNYSGRVEMQTDRVIDTYSFDTDRLEISVGGPIPNTRAWFKRPVTFYFTSVNSFTNTYTPFAINRPSNDYLGLGLNLPERQDNNYSTSLKLAYNLTDDTKQKLTFFMTESFRRWDIYPSGEGGIDGNYGYGYKYNLENRPWAQNKQFSGTITYTNQPTSKTLYSIKLITFRTHTVVQPRGKTPGDFTLLDDIENEQTIAFDRNANGRLDRDEFVDSDGNSYMDGYLDANGDNVFEGGGEGYEDLNINGRWDRGEDWVDLNGNSVFDASEPWIDVVNPQTGQNNLGVFDPWDSFSDLNGNGRWDAAEPQLPEHDWNGNGTWDGERFMDADGDGQYDPWEPWTDLNGNYLWDLGEPFTDKNGNGKFDYGEGYDDLNKNGSVDRRDLQARTTDADDPEPFIDGDFFWDTGEPFIDEPDPITGHVNGSWDQGEIWFDLPSSAGATFGAGLYFIGTDRTLNGQYDGPNFLFDEYELFTQAANWDFNSDRSRPIIYKFNENARGREWANMPNDSLLAFMPGHSTWINRTLHDVANPKFDIRNFTADEGKEWYDDYNKNGKWDREDSFLNEGLWDPTAFWQDRTSTEYTLKSDIQSQVGSHHELKSGFEVKYRNLEMQSISRPDLPYSGEAVLPAGSPWPDRGGIRDFYHYKPIEGAAYAQDKMEFQGLIVNAGLRLDFIIHDQKAIDEFRDRLARDEPGAILAQRGTYRVSPRLGISHPITERSKLYFNYGHFYQSPNFQYFYKSATANFDANTTIGNPNLEYEKTIQYELGVNTQISDYVVIDVAGYYKDQYDLISTADERWKNLTLDRYINLDYGRMRGFELSIEKRPANHYALTFNYDFSYAFGKASDQHANLQSRLKNIPYNYDEHPLNWDETHKINAYLTVLYKENEHPRILGMVFPDDWMATLQWEFGSGLPYSPSKYTTGIENANLILPNSARLPWRERTVLKMEKYYTLNSTKGTRFLFGFTVENLFNKRNVQAVYAETGSPTHAVHPANPAYNPGNNDQDYDANPRNFEPGRQVLFRAGMTF